MLAGPDVLNKGTYEQRSLDIHHYRNRPGTPVVDF